MMIGMDQKQGNKWPKLRFWYLLLGMCWVVCSTGCTSNNTFPCNTDKDCGAWRCQNGQCSKDGLESGTSLDSGALDGQTSPDGPKTDTSLPEEGVDKINPQPDPSPGPQCKTGNKRTCYTGPSGTQNRAPCKAGVQHCVNGKWEANCRGQVLPPAELCNGKDDNCNGKVDESFPENVCTKGRGQGPCREGKPVCIKGVLSCQAVYTAKPEVCGNGFDDDCDGIVDGPPCSCPAGKTRACYTGATGCTYKAGVYQCYPPCKTGTQTCDAKGKAGACVGQVLPSNEVCDGKDNNCNGLVDEKFAQKGKACSVPGRLGECQKGLMSCIRGRVLCAGKNPTKEVCKDNKDNDCDGSIDEGCSGSCQNGSSKACYTNQAGCFISGGFWRCYGTCKPGKQICKNNTWSTCTGSVLPAKEVCDNKDNDCDGSVDEGVCSCKVGSTRSCYTGPKGTFKVGVCTGGTQKCLANGKWTSCEGQILPGKESCDRVDNNCDGTIDEGGVCFVCTPGTKRPCYTGPANTRGVGACKDGHNLCESNGKWSTVCYQQIQPSREYCDKKDNDCDKQTDEGGVCGQCVPGAKRACYTGPANTKGIGACRAGTQTCQSNRAWSGCIGQVLPTGEICDKKDNDCDKQTDEGNTCGQCSPGATRSCYGGPAGTAGKGRCKNGSQKCQSNRQWGACTGQVIPQTEECNRVDDDCDGSIDESFTGQGSTCGQGSGKGICAYGSLICRSGSKVCQSNKPLSYERCGDKLDNDCDGKTDESCGPQYNFGVIRQDGLIRFHRGVTPPKTPQGVAVNPRSGKGVYRIFLKGVHAYQYGLPILVPLTKQPRMITWSRGGLPSLNYEMLAIRTRDLQGNLVDTSFAAVAAQGGVYGRVTSAGTLTHPYPNASAAKIAKVGTGRYQITTTKFISISSTPVFLSLFGENWYGHMTYTTSTKANTFEVRIRDEKGNYADGAFGFWLPETNQAIWAVIQNGKLIRQGPEARVSVHHPAGVGTFTAPANYTYNKTIGFFTLQSSTAFTQSGLESTTSMQCYQFALTPSGSSTRATSKRANGLSLLFVH